MQTRPVIDWKQPSGPSRTGTFTGTNAAVINIGASGSPVAGPQFAGNCSIGGVWYTNTDFPTIYRNTYFHADYGAQWVKNFVFDQNNVPVEARNFSTNVGGIVFLATHPIEGGLFYISWTSTLKRIRYVSSGNLPPTAVASLDRSYGANRLPVQFTGTNSVDPDGLPLLYQWDFGDGSPISTNGNPLHTFTAPAGVPTRYDVTLRVTDSGGLTNSAALIVSVNNTPPRVTITSPVDGDLYPRLGDTVYGCSASIIDDEQDASQLTCAWQTILHHNNHTHNEPVDTNCATTTLISPVGCDGETYFYAIILTVTDAAGLSTTNEVRLHPNCALIVPALRWTNPPAISYGTELSGIQLNANADVPGTLTYNPSAGAILSPGTHQPLSVTFIPDDSLDFTNATASVFIDVLPPPPVLTILLASNSIWKYRDDGSNQGTAWSVPGFDDSAWAAGSAKLGYGNGDDTTIVSYGLDPTNKYITTYFRETFSVPDPSSYTNLLVELFSGSGAVAYLNGAELFRSNMPEGPINFTTLASMGANGFSGNFPPQILWRARTFLRSNCISQARRTQPFPSPCKSPPPLPSIPAHPPR